MNFPSLCHLRDGARAEGVPAAGQRRKRVARARQRRDRAREARRARQAPVVAAAAANVSAPTIADVSGRQAQRKHVARGAQVLEGGRAALAQLVRVPVLQAARILLGFSDLGFRIVHAQHARGPLGGRPSLGLLPAALLVHCIHHGQLAQPEGHPAALLRANAGT